MVYEVGAAVRTSPATRMRRFLRDAAGVTAIEVAILAPVFVGLLFGAIQVGTIYFVKAALESATVNVARLAMTGQVTSYANLKTAMCASMPTLLDCTQILINVTPYTSLTAMNAANPTMTYNADGTVSNTWGTSIGSGGNLMVLQAIYHFPLFKGPFFSFATQGNGSYLAVATSVYVNEN